MKNLKNETYEQYRKRLKKKHSPDLIWKFLEKEFKQNGRDVNHVSEGKTLFKTIFWILDFYKRNIDYLKERINKYELQRILEKLND